MSTELEQSLTTALRDIQSCIGHADTDAMATAKLLNATTSVDKGFCVPRSDGSHDFHKVDTYRLPSHVGWTLIEPSYIEFVNRSMEEQTVDAIAIWLSEHYPELGSDESGKNGDDNKGDDDGDGLDADTVEQTPQTQ